MILRIVLASFFAAAAAFPAVVDFTDMVDTLGVGGEAWIAPKLASAVALGLTITTTGAEFNVGCGTGNSCLGANDVLGGNDFNGDLIGVFAGTTPFLNAVVVNNSVTDLYDVTNTLLGSYQGSFSYSGTPVKWFLFNSQTDAIRTLEFEGSSEVPEPATSAVSCAALVVLALLGFARRAIGERRSH